MNSLNLVLCHTRSIPQGDFTSLSAAAAAEISLTLAPADRESYLSWVSEWKLAWRRLTAEIRLEKALIQSTPDCRPEKKAALAAREESLRELLAGLGNAPAMLLAAQETARAVWGGPRLSAKTARYLLCLRRAGKLAAARRRQQAADRPACETSEP